MTGVTTSTPQDGDGERILLARIAKGETDGNTALNTLAAGVGGATRANGVLLASAARTATTSTSNISVGNCSAVMLYLNVSAASGTGGLKLRINCIDQISGNSVGAYSANSAILAVGQVMMVFGKGLGNINNVTAAGVGATATIGIPVPAAFRVDVIHGDSSSYTYSLNYETVP
jgi:hypothetical protein